MNKLFPMIIAFALAGLLGACDSQGPAERAGEKIDNTMEQAEEKMEQMVDEPDEGPAEEMGEAIDEAAEDAREELEQAKQSME